MHRKRLLSSIQPDPSDLWPPSIDKVSIVITAGLDLHINLALGVVLSTRGVKPFCDICVGSTGDILHVDVAGGVVVANLVAAVVDFVDGSALGGRDLVGERLARSL